MMSASMMRDRYYYKVDDKEQEEDSDLCICGYKLRKDSDYINNQNQLVSIMICDSCGEVEHWVECVSGLLESK